SVMLEDLGGTTLVDATGAPASQGPLRITVPAPSSPPPGGGTPPSPPPAPSPGTVACPPGQPLPVRTWCERPMPPQGQAFMGGNGGKHGRAFFHAGLNGLVFAGGDWKTSQPTLENGDFVGSEIWTLNAATDRWTLLRPFCVPGET